MGFNDQAKALTGARGARKFIFKEGVRYKHMTGAQPIVFRLMPAFNPADPNPGTSYLPCLDPAGNLTDWGTVLKIVRFVGHGKGGAGTRQDLLSLKTFETENQKIWCPLDAVFTTINADPQTWGYMIDDGDRKDKNRPRAPYSKIVGHLICDILDINQTQLGVQLGVFTSGASGKLVDRKDGLVYQPNAAPNAEEMAKQHYIWAYANGDITCPNYAPVLVVEKGDDKGDFSSYKISIAQDNQRRIIRRPVDQAMMVMRYDLSKLNTFLNIPTEDDLVQSLIQLLNGRSPHGYHEHALLKMALPQFQIPEPPSAPSAGPTVAMGFAPSAGVPIPGAVPTVPYQAGPVTTPNYGQGAAVPPPMIPGAVPGGGFAAPTQPSVAVPPPPQMAGMTSTGVVAPVAAVPVPPPPQVAVAAPTGNPAAEMQGVAANAQAAAPAAVPAAPTEPVAPGDPVAPGFNQADFLARIRGKA